LVSSLIFSSWKISKVSVSMSLSLKCLSTSDEISAPIAMSKAAAFWRPFRLLDPMSCAMVG